MKGLPCPCPALPHFWQLGSPFMADGSGTQAPGKGPLLSMQLLRAQYAGLRQQKKAQAHVVVLPKGKAGQVLGAEGKGTRAWLSRGQRRARALLASWWGRAGRRAGLCRAVPLGPQAVMFPTAWALAIGSAGTQEAPRLPERALHPLKQQLRRGAETQKPHLQGSSLLPLGTQTYSRRKLGAQGSESKRWSNPGPSSSNREGKSREVGRRPERSGLCSGNFCGCLYSSGLTEQPTPLSASLGRNQGPEGPHCLGQEGRCLGLKAPTSHNLGCCQ